MNSHQNSLNKNNQKADGEDRRQSDNKKRAAKPNDQSSNDKTRIDEAQRQPQSKLGDSMGAVANTATASDT